MLFQIRNRYTDSVMFEVEADSFVRAVEQKVKEKAYLRDADLRDADLGGAYLGDAYLGGAYLRGAYLRDANLRGANLRDADLGGANLRDADLRDADLGGAYLRDADLRDADLGGAYLGDAYLGGAYLRGAYLRDAYLGGAYLRDAYLRGAYLGGAYLRDANLRGAYLGDAYLRGAKGITKYQTTSLLILLDQPGKIRAYKLTDRDGNSPTQSSNKIHYEVGKTYEVGNAGTDENIHCDAGVNVATMDWCLREYRPGYRLFLVEFTAKDIAAIPTNTDGKFRLFRCKVVKELNVKEYLPEPTNA